MRRLLLAALLFFALPAAAIDTALCTADGITATPLGTRPGGGATCLEIDPGNGQPNVKFQYEEFDETTVGIACDGGGSTVTNVFTTSGGPKTLFWNNLVLDNYRSQSCQNDDVVFFGGGEAGTGKYDHEFLYIRDSQILNGWKCSGSAWTGTGTASGLSCPSTKSKAHSDGIQYRGQPVNNGWLVMQGSEPGLCKLVNGFNLQMLSQVDDGDGALGSIVFQGCQIGRVNTQIGQAVHWVDDCNDRQADPSGDLCETGSVQIGNGPPNVVLIDIWGTTLVSPSGDGGVPGKVVVVNTGCNKNGCDGTVGYSNGWPHPLRRSGTGPGTCPNGSIGSSPPTYCFTSVENMVAANLDFYPNVVGTQNLPPMVANSPIGYADAPGAGLSTSVVLSPNPVEVNGTYALSGVPNGGTGPFTYTWDTDGDGACDDNGSDNTSPYSSGNATAPASPTTRTLKLCVADSAAGSATRSVQQSVVPDCGDGTITLPEVCDTSGPQLGGATCTSQGFSGGTLGCTAGCQSLDTASFTGGPTCGDSVCSPNEAASGPAGPDACFADCAAYTASIVCKNDEGWDYCVPDLEGGERVNLKDSITREFAIFIDIDPEWEKTTPGGIQSMWLDHTGPAGEPNRDTRQNNPVFVFPGDTGAGGIQNTLPWTPALLKGTHNFKIRPCSENMTGATNAPVATDCTGGPGGTLGPQIDITLSFSLQPLVDLGKPTKPLLAVTKP